MFSFEVALAIMEEGVKETLDFICYPKFLFFKFFLFFLEKLSFRSYQDPSTSFLKLEN